MATTEPSKSLTTVGPRRSRRLQRSRIVRLRPKAHVAIVLALPQSALRRRLVVHHPSDAERIHVAEVAAAPLAVRTRRLAMIVPRQVVLESVAVRFGARDAIVGRVLRRVAVAQRVVADQRRRLSLAVGELRAPAQRRAIEDRSLSGRHRVERFQRRFVGEFRCVLVASGSLLAAEGAEQRRLQTVGGYGDVGGSCVRLRGPSAAVDRCVPEDVRFGGLLRQVDGDGRRRGRLLHIGGVRVVMVVVCVMIRFANDGLNNVDRS